MFHFPHSHTITRYCAWIIPLFSGVVFLSGLIALLASWAAEGYPQYQPGEGKIVYVSDVGAHLKPFFVSIF
jgi:hypothetical protein